MEHADGRHLEQGPVALLGAGEARLSLATGRHIRKQRNRTGDAAVLVDVGHIHHRPDFALASLAQPQLEGVAATDRRAFAAEHAHFVRMHESSTELRSIPGSVGHSPRRVHAR